MTDKKETFWSVPYVTLMVANLFQSMAAFMVNTTLPVYISVLGGSASIIGIITGAFGISALAIRPFAGPAFDSFSRKKLLIFCQGLICVSIFLYGIIKALPLFFVVRLVQGVGIGCSGSLAMSLVSEYLPESKFSSGVSVYTLAQSMGQVIGPASGLWLVETIGFSPSYFIAAGSLVLAMLGVATIKEKPRQRPPYELKLSRSFIKSAVSKAVVLAMLGFAFACVTSYLVLYCLELGIENAGLFFTVYALCLLGTRPVFGTLSDKHGPQRVLLFGVCCFAASFVVISFMHSFWMLMVAAVISAGGYGSCAPLVQSLAMKSTTPDRRGAASNTAYTGLDIGTLLGSAAGGIIADHLASVLGSMAAGYSAMWLVLIIPIAVAFGVILSWNIRKQ